MKNLEQQEKGINAIEQKIKLGHATGEAIVPAEMEGVPEWKRYVDSFSDEELLRGQRKNGEKLDFSKLNRSAEDFGVKAEDYPIFDRQGTYGDTGDECIRWNIDKTLSQYLTFTANTIGVLDGRHEDQHRGQYKGLPRMDEVIYLDKSARPVSKFVEAFWQEFAMKDTQTNEPVKMPNSSFLSIDRLVWCRRVGLDVNEEMYFTDNGGNKRKAGFADFMKAVSDKPISLRDIAAIRALYIEGGRTTDDIEEIMRTPTILDGKNVAIIDEVSDTGTTVEIARFLLEEVFPEAKSINTYIFSNFGVLVINDEYQMKGSPVWYPNDHGYAYGRGVLNPRKEYWEEQYAKNPTPENYAKLQASFVVGEELDFDLEPYQESRELFREIKQMAEDYRAGRILFQAPNALDWCVDDSEYLAILRQGINPANYTKIVEAINARPASEGYSTKFPPHLRKK